MVEALDVEVLLNDGKVFIRNNSDKEVNIGGFKLSTNDNVFTFPKDTIMSPGLNYISNDATSFTDNTTQVTFTYPNKRVISQYTPVNLITSLQMKLEKAQQQLNTMIIE